MPLAAGPPMPCLTRAETPPPVAQVFGHVARSSIGVRPVVSATMPVE